MLNSQEQLMTLIAHAAEKKIINPNELKLIEHSLSARNTPIDQVMLNKSQTITLSHQSTIEDALGIYSKTKHSRYPVIDDNHNICGILLIKDLIPLGDNTSTPIINILRTPHFTPSSQSVLSLLNRMQQTYQHMSIVLDEYGQFQGVVTIEDLLEQIVGQIEDEYDDHHPEYIIKLAHGEFLVQGATPIEQYNRYFEAKLDTQSFDTIAGIVSHHFGYIPKKGETITIHDMVLTIHKASATAIKELHVNKETSSPGQESN